MFVGSVNKILQLRRKRRGGSYVSTSFELALIDFKNAIYRMRGSSVPIDVVQIQNTDWGVWDKTQIVPTLGWGGIDPSTTQFPLVSDNLFTSINPGLIGCTVILDVDVTALPAAGDSCGIQLLYAPIAFTANQLAQVTFTPDAGAGTTITLGDNIASSVTVNTALNNAGFKRIAISMSQTGIFMSINGSVVYSRLDADLVDPDATWTAFGVNMIGTPDSRLYIEKMRIIPLQASTALPALST